MALDGEGLAAVELLLKDPKCKEQLRSPERNRRELGQFLDDRSDAERSDYAAIIEEAHRRLLAGGGLAAPAPAVRPGGEQGKHRQGAPRQRQADESLIFAPYRFIEIAADVVPPAQARIPLDEAVKGLWSGSIQVEWIAETPLLIGGPTRPDEQGRAAPAEPLEIGGRHVIPGATIRGLVRTACEIVGQAKLPRGNWHHRYGIRDFDHPYYRTDSGITQPASVSAGMLTIRKATAQDPTEIVAVNDEVWEIRFCEWRHVPLDTLTPANGLSGSYSPDKTLLEKYRAAGMSDGRSAPDFSRMLAFSHMPEENGRKRMALDRNGGARGVPVFSGKLPGGGNKRFEYAVFPDPKASPRPVPADIVRDFLRLHTRPNKNKLEPAFSWADLRSAAYGPNGVPVFTIGDPGKPGAFFFGLTRLFKIPHRRSVGDVIQTALPKHKPRGRLGPAGRDGRRRLAEYEADMVENLFGYVVEPGDLHFVDEADSIDPAAVALKGRVAFGFAWLSTDTPAKVDGNPVELIQMAPRASFAPYYLKGVQEKDYSIGDVAPAGYKSYFPRYQKPDSRKALADMRSMGEAQIDAVTGGGKRSAANVTSRLKFLIPAAGKPLSFTGSIRVHNLRPEEVGLLLFAILHGSNEAKGRYRHLMGRARPFGAGQMRVGDVVLALEPNDGGEGGVAGIDGFIERFADYMRKAGAPAFPRTPSVLEWLGMADPANAVGKLEYQLDVQKFAKVRDMVKAKEPSLYGPPLQNRTKLLKTPRG